MKTRKGVNLNCNACNKEFYVPDYRKNTAKFCSLECQNHKQYDKYIFNCLSCNKKVITSPSRRNYKNKKFCSLDCRTKLRMDIKERRKAQKAWVRLNRNEIGRTLRVDVFALKNKICEICGYYEYDFCLDIHHIDNDPKNNVLSNLAVLCCMCHRKLHKGLVML
jgi:hypothetical protein